jgi:hypothetical protein
VVLPVRLRRGRHRIVVRRAGCKTLRAVIRAA